MSDEKPLNVGDRLKDNDPRQTGRVLTITEVLPNGVRARRGGYTAVTILRRRIYTDGKPRRNGFDLVRAE